VRANASSIALAFFIAQTIHRANLAFSASSRQVSRDSAKSVFMKKLPVDLGELQLALEDYDGGLGLHTYWFDRQTGDVVFLTEDLEEQDELRKQIEEDTDDRFVQIEPIDSNDGFRIMQDFVETMPPSRLRAKLEW
jgi:hypothetical protein